MTKLFICLFIILSINFNYAQIIVNSNTSAKDNCFIIMNDKESCEIIVDENDYELVKTSANILSKDIFNISGVQPKVSNNKKTKYAIIIGSIDNSIFIKELEKRKKINTSEIKGQWERYIIKTIDKPFKNIEKALVIAGSDRRGTAYGVFDLSQAIGISPWYYWADVPIVKKDFISINNIDYTSKAPSVKYRGIFINDEDWGLHPWAAKNIDPDVNDIGPNTYEKIFELVLRLKGNMVAPAMHECTKAFYTVNGNMEMADKYGIMITTSHCEPLLYNNASEWNDKTQGEWNYINNKEEINRVLDERVKKAAKYENIYTIALRGKHDEAMKGGSLEEKIGLLNNAIKSQREILQKHIDKPIEEIPQIFIPYKEVLELYEKGLDLPDDIIIVWPDDNYGYIKKLTNDKERRRSGGTGVYYHISYLGWPNDYLWLNTTPPALMYSEMQKAWNLGANKYWLLNVGDIKPGEMATQLFLDMAWDFDKFNFDNINEYYIKYHTDIFGDRFKDKINYIIDKYFHLNFIRKPEYMTWDWKWNSIYSKSNIKDTEFSFINYNEAENRMKEFDTISQVSESVMNELNESLRPVFFELIHYPVKAATLYNKEMLTAQKNRWYAKQGRAMTNAIGEKAQSYHDSLEILTNKYNSLINGKWKGMMTAPGFLPYKHYPPTVKINLSDSIDFNIQVENDEENNYVLPCFYNTTNKKHYIDIYNKSNKEIKWNIYSNDKWINIDRKQGKTMTEDRVFISINWNLINSEDTAGTINIKIDNKEKCIRVYAKKVEQSDSSVYIEDNGVICIEPTLFHNKSEKGNIKFQTIKGLGYCNKTLQLGNAMYDINTGKNKNIYDSYVEYKFECSKKDSVTIYVYMLPLFPKDSFHNTSYGISLDNSQVTIINNNPKEYTMGWANNVMRNSTLNKLSLPLDNTKYHNLRIYCIDPGMIIQKIIIDCGGLKKSYTGPMFQNIIINEKQ